MGFILADCNQELPQIRKIAERRPHTSARALILLLFGSAFCSDNAAEGGGFRPSFDPSVCKEDAHGKLYVGLGRNVLAVPNKGLFVVQAIAPPPRTRDERIAPPDLTEPEGCPGNPQQDSAFNFPVEYQPSRNGSPVLPAIHLRVKLYRTLEGNAKPAATDQIWSGEDVQIGLAELECKDQAVTIERTSSGFKSCLIPSQNYPNNRNDWGGAYVALPEIYKTPLGRPFIITCYSGQVSLPGADCQVSYTLRAGLGLSYRMKIVNSPDAIPLEKVLDMDLTNPLIFLWEKIC